MQVMSNDSRTTYSKGYALKYRLWTYVILHDSNAILDRTYLRR